MCTIMQIVITEHLPCGREYVATCCFLQCKQQEDIRAGSEEPLLQVPEPECEESSDQGEVAQLVPPVIHFDQYCEPVLKYKDTWKNYH